MANRPRFHWVRVILAIFAAEALPILALIVVVVIYGFTRQEGSLSPEDFAPRAGLWVGPIGGFISVFLFSLWVARYASSRPILHGFAVGIGTAILDFTIGMLAGGGSDMLGTLILSNTGRTLAGLIGGWVTSRTTRAAVAAL